MSLRLSFFHIQTLILWLNWGNCENCHTRTHVSQHLHCGSVEITEHNVVWPQGARFKSYILWVGAKERKGEAETHSLWADSVVYKRRGETQCKQSDFRNDVCNYLWYYHQLKLTKSFILCWKKCLKWNEMEWNEIKLASAANAKEAQKRRKHSLKLGLEHWLMHNMTLDWKIICWGMKVKKNQKGRKKNQDYSNERFCQW